MKLGFTGTRSGMTIRQKTTFLELLEPMEFFHHGMCIGADTDAHNLLRMCKVRTTIVGHPATKKFAQVQSDCDVFMEPKPFLERNKDIVKSVDKMVATPGEFDSQRRGGTWSTIRYAVKKGVPCSIIFPDGTVRDAAEFCKPK